jgi:hypothetical protein
MDLVLSLEVVASRPTDKVFSNRIIKLFGLQASSYHCCSLSRFPKPPGPGLPRPGGKHGYRAVTAVTVKNRIKPCKIYQKFKLFFKFI